MIIRKHIIYDLALYSRAPGYKGGLGPGMGGPLLGVLCLPRMREAGNDNHEMNNDKE